MKHWVKGGYNYYFNLKTREGTWDEPAGFVQNNTQLNKDEIQVNIQKDSGNGSTRDVTSYPND